MPVVEVEIALVIFIASLVQTLAGFGFGLVCIPFFLVLGLPLPGAILLASVCSFLNTAQAAWIFRKDGAPKEAAEASAIRLLFIPVGVFFLYSLENFDPALTKKWAGWALLFLLVLGKIPKKNLYFKSGPWSFYFASAISGFMAAAVGVGGPPLVLWSASKGWPPEKRRAFTLTVFSWTLLPLVVLTMWKFPEQGAKTPFRLLYGIPVLYLGVYAGRFFAPKISPKALHRIIEIILILGSLKLAFGIL